MVKMTEFKIGDRVRVIGNSNRHCHKIGDVVTLTKSPHVFYGNYCGDNKLAGWINPYDMEHVETKGNDMDLRDKILHIVENTALTHAEAVTAIITLFAPELAGTWGDVLDEEPDVQQYEEMHSFVTPDGVTRYQVWTPEQVVTLGLYHNLTMWNVVGVYDKPTHTIEGYIRPVKGGA
jgi:hypothetical protein